MSESQGWIDNQGDVWRLGDDGLMYTFETAPFSREYVEKKWGPLKPAQSTEDECNCYPGGFSPETYEGPQHHCPVHGHGNDLQPRDCPLCHADRRSLP